MSAERGKGAVSSTVDDVGPNGIHDPSTRPRSTDDREAIQRHAPVKPAWSDVDAVRVYAGRAGRHLRGATRLRESVLREWGSGDARGLDRVTDAAGAPLTPRQIDWSGMVDPPKVNRRGGARMGAGRTTESGPRTSILHLRCTPDDRERWERAAEAEGVDLSEWVRETLDEQAGRRAS